MVIVHDLPSRRARRRGEEIEFRLIYAAAFPLFLAAAVLGRLARPMAERRRSIIAEARAAADTVLPFAFMG